MKRSAEQFGRSFQFDNVFFEGELLELANYNIRQIGELCCEGGYQIKPHTQVCDEVSVILSGTGVFLCGDKEYAVKKGDIIISPVGTKHVIRADDKQSMRFFYLGFDFRKDPTEEPYLSVNQLFRTAENHKAAAHSEIDVYLFAVLDEFYQKKLGFTTMANAYIEQIILMAARAFIELPQKKYIPNLDNSGIGNSAYAVIRYVDQNILNITDIKSIAAELGYSYTYLSHMFKKKTNMTLQYYISLRRMEWAKQMLSQKTMTVTQVADALGYDTMQSFSRAFRRMIGQSPAAYGKNVQNK